MNESKFMTCRPWICLSHACMSFVFVHTYNRGVLKKLFFYECVTAPECSRFRFTKRIRYKNFTGTRCTKWLNGLTYTSKSQLMQKLDDRNYCLGTSELKIVISSISLIFLLIWFNFNYIKTMTKFATLCILVVIKYPWYSAEFSPVLWKNIHGRWLGYPKV